MKTSKTGKKEPKTTIDNAKAETDILEVPVLPTAKAEAVVPEKKSATAKKRSSSVEAKASGTAEVPNEKVKLSAKKQKAVAATSPVRKAKKAAAKTETEAEAIVDSEPIVTGPVDLPVDPLAAVSPVDKLLAQPVLPELERENRARLQMQSPTKLHFYWSIRENPWAILRRAFGNETGSYTLILKLVEMRSGYEQIHNADAEGNWWFDVRPNGKYRAEIGFYAPNRPFIRIVYSNTIETPRLKPSPHRAAEPQWTVPAQKFAQVLDVAGFARDAFDVAVAGDDPMGSASAARQALTQFANGNSDKLAVIDDDDIRYAMLAFAEGQKLDDMRWTIGPELFDYFRSSDEPLDAERAGSALREHFDLEELEFETEETGPAVFGASLVNFPRSARSKRRPRIGKGLSPESSHSLSRSNRPQ